ncbi:MAG: FG-GAP repeat domain-containing protein [Vicinamibacterales bacterium]
MQLKLVIATGGLLAIVAIGLATPVAIHRLALSPEAGHVVAVYEGTRPDALLVQGPLADLNGDGLSDVVLSAAGAKELSILFGGSITKAGNLPESARVTIRGSENGLYTGARAGDVDGDGLADLLVVVLLHEPDTLRASGSTYLLKGRREWPSVLDLPGAADATFSFPQAQDIRMGPCASDSPSDLNLDGIDDVILGAAEFTPAGRRSAGAALVFFGRRQWPRTVDVERDADIRIDGSRSGEGLAAGCDTGDFNGDGRADLALLAPEETLWRLLGGRGRYYVFFGRERWPQVLDAATDSDVRIDGQRPLAALNPPVLADLNGDGIDDLVLASSRTSATPPMSAELAVFWGRRDMRTAIVAMTAADVVITGGSAESMLADAIAAADVDQDGLSDLLLSERGSGRLLAVLGQRDWPAKVRFEDLQPLELARVDPGGGSTGLRVGDVDGDHLPEVALTAVDAAVTGHGRSGRAWLIKPHRSIAIDVRPDHEPNVLYRPGLLVVRIAGATMPPGDRVEPATVRLAGVAPARHVWRDFDGDRIDDLQLYFETAGMAVTAETHRVALTARTLRGALLGGVDSVVVMPGLADVTPDGPPPAPDSVHSRR